MSGKVYKWHKIAEGMEDLSFAPNNIALADLDGKKICIGKFQDKLFAFAYKCPHAGGIMADGWIDALGNVVCPLHRYKFSMLNGRNVSGEGYYLKHWPIEVREDGIYAGVDDKGLFSWL
ncbi:Rieske 2Fe-2S domain-containing protein [Flavihumibacter rivuli]|uniref:Rieske (2Fe-2S) protein n=1 Tax=Flavihumibacter rivuli TaxID=2838156 RepID=UPI001BDE50D0|nr:Rieske 2Fe-2S domain-containing protein [Flavihumibacter rivuli]ULQ55992.1 Rieske 2Fe-2S domain-containing protein [Flavihumibacter rivuli]